MQVVLLDSVRKRCDFLTRACTTMDIPNVKVVWARAEAAGQSRTHREVWLLAEMLAEGMHVRDDQHVRAGISCLTA